MAAFLCLVGWGCAARTEAPAVQEPAGGTEARHRNKATQVDHSGALTACNDGVDNDGDGYIDAAFDPGCYASIDPTESAGSRAQEAGFTTFEFGVDSRVVYVSSEGADSFDGSSPERAVATLSRAASLVRDGHHDFILLRRGDTFRSQYLGRFKSGRDAQHPLVIASYGDALELPRIELAGWFIDHDSASGSNLALLDLHFVQFEKDPKDLAFTGTGVGGLRFVGGGENLLIEGCHLEYVELIVQSHGEDQEYKNVSVRNNVVEKSYHAGTCLPGDPKGNVKFRPSGIYASHVQGLTIEGNLFDHNGWNEDSESACATIYNHNVYLNADGLKLVNNIFTRASSMHVKLRSDRPRDMVGTEIFDNLFIEGEIGISAGGNTTEPARFIDTKISSNVFLDVGVSQPTKRGLSWGIDISDHENLLIEKNIFFHGEVPSNNTFGLRLAGAQRNVVVRENVFYGSYGRALSVFAAPGHERVSIISNQFFDLALKAQFVGHVGDFSAYSYENNEFVKSQEPGFFVGEDVLRLNEWKKVSGDEEARELAASALPEGRFIFESYSKYFNLGASLEAFLQRAAARSRLQWDNAVSARRINAYLRASVAR